MKATVIPAHPYPESFDHAIYGTIRATLADLDMGTHAHDLYAEGFNPVPTASELATDRSDAPPVNACAAELTGRCIADCQSGGL